MQLAIKMLTCPYLQPKIKAINEFKDFIDRVNTMNDFINQKLIFLYFYFQQ